MGGGGGGAQQWFLCSLHHSIRTTWKTPAFDCTVSLYNRIRETKRSDDLTKYKNLSWAAYHAGCN